MGSQFEASLKSRDKLGINLATPGLVVQRVIHCTATTPLRIIIVRSPDFFLVHMMLTQKFYVSGSHTMIFFYKKGCVYQSKHNFKFTFFARMHFSFSGSYSMILYCLHFICLVSIHKNLSFLCNCNANSITSSSHFH